MVFSTLYDYAKKNNLTLHKNMVPRSIYGYVILREDGTYKRLELSLKPVEKYVPLSANNKPSPLCIKLGDLLKCNGQYDAINKMLEDGSATIPSFRTVYTFLNTMKTCSDFRDKVTHDFKGFKLKGFKPVNFLSFSIDYHDCQEKPCLLDRTDWVPWWEQYVALEKDESSKKGKKKSKNSDTEDEFNGLTQSALTGEYVKPVTGSWPPTKVNELGGMFSLYSNQPREYSGAKGAFSSYGLISGIGCPMSSDEIYTVTEGFNDLMDVFREKDIPAHHNRLLNLMFWYDNNSNGSEADDQLVSRALENTHADIKTQDDDDDDGEDDDDITTTEKNELASHEYSKVLQSVMSNCNASQNVNFPGTYHFITYRSVEQQRVRFDSNYDASYAKIHDSLAQWYADTELKYGFYKKDKNGNTQYYQYHPTIDNLFDVLYQSRMDINGKDSKTNFENEFGADCKLALTRAMLFGGKIPDVFLRNAVKLVTKKHIASKTFDNERRKLATLLQIEKVALLRYRNDKGEKEYTVMSGLNVNETNVGYVIGRYLATLEEIQRRHIYFLKGGKVPNTTIVDANYGAIKSHPLSGLNHVMTKVQHYLSDLDKVKGSRADEMHTDLASISAMFDDGYPVALSLKEQAMFDIGYQQQYQSYAEKRKERIEAAKAKNEAEKASKNVDDSATDENTEDSVM